MYVVHNTVLVKTRWIRYLELVCDVQEEEEALLETVLGER
jgi:hypothetical protein